MPCPDKQSWFPDGQYLAPGDDALMFDIQVLKSYGMNFIRLHQKVNWKYILSYIMSYDFIQPHPTQISTRSTLNAGTIIVTVWE